MKIMIPMSGLGSRFIAAGYSTLKPLIRIHGKPMIQWVVNMFDQEDEFIFLCREEHLKDIPEMRSLLQHLAPYVTIVSIKGAKKGPGWAVAQAYNYIKDDEPIIISYCDYFQIWDHQHFYQWTKSTQCDGAVICYKGFHPHLTVPENLYASCRVDKDNNLLEIREKFSFTEDKTLTPQSGGAYYFRTGALVKKYCTKLIDTDTNLNGEYYTSLVYNLLVSDHLNVKIYDQTRHFCQWGTPKDLEEYLRWGHIFLGENNG